MSGHALRLPNLLIVGVSRAGTTSLFTYLSSHPEICPSRIKEPHYFSPIRLGEQPRQSIDQYAANFGACDDQRYRLEATPVYFFGGPAVISAITSTLPHVRAIVSLRNPVDRLWSNYQYKLSRGQEQANRSFESFVDRCEEVLSAAPEEAARAGSYRALLTGRYGDFIGEWFTALGPRFKVVFFDDLKRDPRGVVAHLVEWLDLDAALLPEFPVVAKNATVQPRSVLLHRAGLQAAARLAKDPVSRGPMRRLLLAGYRSLNMRRADATMDPHMRRRLEELFSDANRRLAAELDARGYSDLPAWLSS